MMNTALKAKIVERFGYQREFAQTMRVNETIVSAVVHRVRTLTPTNRKVWARVLGIAPSDPIFDLSK